MFSFSGKEKVMKSSQEYFVAGFNRLFNDENKRRKKAGKKKLTKTFIAKKLNMELSHLSGFLGFHRNYGDEKREEMAALFNCSALDVLNIGKKELANKGEIELELPLLEMTATSTATTQTPCPTCQGNGKIADIQDEHDKKHTIVIKNFTDKKLALKMNEMLVAIEKADRDLFLKLYGKIESAFEDLPKEESIKKTGT